MSKSPATAPVLVDPVPAGQECIRLRGVRQNNLRGFDLDLPLRRLTVVTGLSGTGKSSLVFETLHAEGQRRYVETFSPYTRQFLEMMDRPKVDRIENIRPSIAIQQRNSVKTSRSTVGTMTELCDYFKVWFAQEAVLIDPATGRPIEHDYPARVWQKVRAAWGSAATALIGFRLRKPSGMTWAEVLGHVSGQGFSRVMPPGDREIQRLRGDDVAALAKRLEETPDAVLTVVADRVKLSESQRARFVEVAAQAYHFGQGELVALRFVDHAVAEMEVYTEALHSPSTGVVYRPATPNLFSFNSPVGACEKCRGFGRVIEIDERLVIPDSNLSIRQGAIRPFTGDVYRNSLKDLTRHACKAGLRLDVPWRDLTPRERAFVMEGEDAYPGDVDEAWTSHWYGVRRFFSWLESNTYKMHVRVFLWKFRAYTTCPACKGGRLRPEALNWRWRGYTLPDLYRLPLDELRVVLMQEASLSEGPESPARHESHHALQEMVTRLNYLGEVGLDYLTLDRHSRTLSGGEVERINLTTCLGTALTDTLFILDEPSVGLHARDIDRLNRVLRRLVDAGNTVVVVEHDEAVMRGADYLVELGPEPGRGGGEVVFAGSLVELLSGSTPAAIASLTGKCLRGEFDQVSDGESFELDPADDVGQLVIKNAYKHTLRGVDVALPLQQLVAVTGVSGSGKSTLLNRVLHDGLRERRGLSAEDPAEIGSVTGLDRFGEIALVDQTSVSRTPRSNPAVYIEAWDDIRKLLARTESAKERGMSASTFSFNAGNGRCEHCQGLGYETIEMQFLADVHTLCPVCEGRRFKPETLAVTWCGHSVADLLELDIASARRLFKDHARIAARLDLLDEVGLGYLTLGQPLNTLSGGESQRLKLVKYLSGLTTLNGHGALLLLDEPTTGLHRMDVGKLLKLLRRLVFAGHSVVVIEHQLDVIAAADWVIEMGPEAGERGGQVVFTGTPAELARSRTVTGPFLAVESRAQPHVLKVAEPTGAILAVPRSLGGVEQLRVIGAREHNLRNLTLSIPHRALNVVTGVSGSGKSSLAFDIVFGEGQRRFMESMSAYARQFVEQLPRAQVDGLEGIAPTVAIEQRVTRGTRKSTVATVTEVAQYLRLLYARVGVQHSPVTGEPVQTATPSALAKRLEELLGELPQRGVLRLAAPLIRGRKGHHEPVATWARDHGIPELRCDGVIVATEKFRKLDRYREHDVEALLPLPRGADAVEARAEALREALRMGKGACLLIDGKGKEWGWLATARTDPATGEAFPELDPKHFSWNSARGWCPWCRGYGHAEEWMADREDFAHLGPVVEDEVCPECQGTRLNRISRAVRLPVKAKARGRFDGAREDSISLPELLALPPAKVLFLCSQLKLDRRGRAIVAEIEPEIRERLQFLDRVGLGYLRLDRASATLSGGEAQRIRLAAQLGTNLAGVLYVLDEPSIGLHARDNEALIASLLELRDKGNTLLVVEHDADTMAAADHIIDLGPGAGVNGGQLLAEGTLEAICRNENSLTGRYLRERVVHPLRGAYRELPKAWNPRAKKRDPDWLILRGARLRNLRGHDLMLPLGRLTMVGGVSGAGKSTLLRDCLLPAVQVARERRVARLSGTQSGLSVPFQDIHNGHVFRSVIEVEQNPIGKTPRSTPATYIGAFDIIREYFASLPEAKMRGYGSGAFSFNTKGGRCEACKGAGRIKIEMQFLPDSYVLCEACGGRRYGAEIDEIRWNGQSIAEVLKMDFAAAAEFFSFHSRLSEMLGLMVETGLGYLELGQSSPTLSGGEAQRLKLVGELIKGLPTFMERSRGAFQPNLYLLEEPTIGLHLADVERLTHLLHRLVDLGHTVIVIEHSLELLAEADWLVEIGPEGGAGGGEILFQGPVADLKACKRSRTWRFLRGQLAG